MKFEIDEKGKLIRVRPSSINEVIIDIPSNVTSIGEGAFFLCGDIDKVNIPCSVKTIENKAFYKSKIKEIVIPPSIENIGSNAFGSCHYLEKVEIKANLRKIPEYCFSSCLKLKEITLPSTIEEIEKFAFCGCYNLKKLILPESLKKIGASSFGNCKSLKKINIPNSVDCVDRGAFEFCEELKEVGLSTNIEAISEGMFSNCLKLETINFELIKTIEKEAFKNCISLKNIILPNTVTIISEKAFLHCNNLENIQLSKKIKIIEKEAFSNCFNLAKIEIPYGIKEISENAFFNCKNLKNVILPNSIKTIGNCAFRYCSNLEEINIPLGTEKIGSNAFQNCIVLSKVNLPNSLKKIEYAAFENCKKLTKITIPQSVSRISLAVFDGTPIEQIEIRNFPQLFEIGIKYVKGLNFAFFDEKNGNIVLSKEMDDTLENYRLLSKKWYINSLGYHDLSRSCILSIIFGEETEDLGRFENMLALLSENINKNNYREIKENITNKKEFERLLKQIENKLSIQDEILNDMCFDLFKLSYSLGAFSNNKVYRQRACEFIMNILEKQIITIEDVHASFESMNLKVFNEEWAEFLMNKQNFTFLIRLEKEQTGYISRIYNSFDDIKEYGRSNRGDQHYRKVTLKMCEEYLSNVVFKHVDEENVDIAETISKFTRNQESFEKAAEIRKDYLELVEQGEIKEYIIDNINDVLSDLNEIANNNFTIEFLNKYDPINFVLGKYCSCCAHLEGVGSGIMQASILHPDCQNLIIKDNEGKIIAKSTLYINRKQGYGVFNNVEINNNITNNEIKQKIYEKYLEAIRKIALTYNSQHPLKQLTQINVGMHLNDLEKQIRMNDKKGNILNSINFSNYGSYKGDWQKEQYIIWKKDEKKR